MSSMVSREIAAGSGSVSDGAAGSSRSSGYGWSHGSSGRHGGVSLACEGPSRLVTGGTTSGGITRRGARSRALRQALRRDAVEPGPEQRAALEARAAPPGAQHRFLHHVLGFVEGPEHPIAVHMELPPVWFRDGREGVGVAGPQHGQVVGLTIRRGMIKIHTSSAQPDDTWLLSLLQICDIRLTVEASRVEVRSPPASTVAISRHHFVPLVTVRNPVQIFGNPIILFLFECAPPFSSHCMLYVLRTSDAMSAGPNLGAGPHCCRRESDRTLHPQYCRSPDFARPPGHRRADNRTVTAGSPPGQCMIAGFYWPSWP